MRAAFSRPAAVETDKSSDPVQQWAENRGACVEARMQAEAEAVYWASDTGCAAALARAVPDPDGYRVWDDYCKLDPFCPDYEHGCYEIWAHDHGGNL